MAFESGNIVKNLQTVYGEVQAYDPSLNPAGGPVGKDGPPGARQGETVEIPPGFTGEVLRSDDLTTIAIYPIHSTGKLEPMLIKVEDFTASFKRVVRHNPFIWDKQRDLKDPGRPLQANVKEAALTTKPDPFVPNYNEGVRFYDGDVEVGRLEWFLEDDGSGGTYIEWLGGPRGQRQTKMNPRHLLGILNWIKENLPAPYRADFWNKKLLDTITKIAPGLISPGSTFTVKEDLGGYSELAGLPLDRYDEFKNHDKFVLGNLSEWPERWTGAFEKLKKHPQVDWIAGYNELDRGEKELSERSSILWVYDVEFNKFVLGSRDAVGGHGSMMKRIWEPAQGINRNAGEWDEYFFDVPNPRGELYIYHTLASIGVYADQEYDDIPNETVYKAASELLEICKESGFTETSINWGYPGFGRDNQGLGRPFMASLKKTSHWLDGYYAADVVDGIFTLQKFEGDYHLGGGELRGLYNPTTQDLLHMTSIDGGPEQDHYHHDLPQYEMQTYNDFQKLGGFDAIMPMWLEAARKANIPVKSFGAYLWNGKHENALQEGESYERSDKLVGGYLDSYEHETQNGKVADPFEIIRPTTSMKFISALINPDDPLDEPGLKEVIDAQEVPWWTYPRDQREQAVANSLRVGILSPLKLLKFNAVHYQDIAHIPAEETDINVYLEALGQRREKWNQRGQADIFGNPEDVAPFDPKNNEAYAGYIHKHLQYIVNISQHIKELTDAAEQDVMQGGEGFIWREALMKLRLPGANSKVSSFAWLLLAPKTSQLATIDTHMLRALGADERMAANPEGYAHLENELKAGRDALGYQHMPLGQFQWGLWDYVRTPPDETGYHHQNHGAMKVLDPTPYDQIDWHVPPSARGERPLPDWWLKTRDARDPLRMEWELKRKRPVKPQTPVEDDAALKLFAALDKFAGVKESHWLDGYVAAILDPALEEMEIAEDESQFHRHVNESMTYNSHWRGLYNPRTKDLLHMSTKKADIYAGEMSSLSQVKPYFNEIRDRWLRAAAKHLDVSGSSTFGAFVIDDTLEHEVFDGWPGPYIIDNEDREWTMTHNESIMNSVANPSFEGTPYMIYRGEQQPPQPVDEQAADDFMKTWTDYFGITAKWEKVGHWLQGYYGAVVTKSGGEMKVAPDPHMFHQYIETNIALRGIYNPDTCDLLHMSVGWDTEMDELDLDITVQPELYELKEEWLAAAGFSGYEVRTFGALVADSGFNPDDFPLGDFGVFEQENATVDNLPEGHKIIRG